MVNNRLPPQNLAAERAVLGACLLSRDALAMARKSISADDWYLPQHEMLWALMLGLAEKDQPVDALTLAGAVMDAGQVGKLTNGLVYLHELVSDVATAANVNYHAELVADAAVHRRLISSLESGVQRAYAAAAGANGASISELIAHVHTDLNVVQRMDGIGPISGLLTWHQFYTEHAGRASNWVVPGLIGRKDVWMILAPPGAGKSTLTRQLAWCVAVGVHPFHMDLVLDEPGRSLVIDLENDEGMVADESLDHYGRINHLGCGTEDRGWIWSRPQGINLRKADDIAVLDRVLEETRPDFVGFGSLNNSFVRTGDWDQVAGEVREALNFLRTKHQCALWIEHHMPKASDTGRKRTPFGSSLFESWPSHGRVLEKTDEKKRHSPWRFGADFRGDRGRREMPVGFERGGRYPWTAIWTHDDLDAKTETAT